MGNTLQKARAFENKYLPRVEGSDVLPRFHMTAGVGWIESVITNSFIREAAMRETAPFWTAQESLL